MSDLRARIVAEAMSWLGTPFHTGAQVKGAGVDCANLLSGVYQAVGLIPKGMPLPSYSASWFLHQADNRFLDELEKYAHCVPSPEPGDVAMFRFGRAVSHGGIIVSWPTIIHARGDSNVLLQDVGRSANLASRVAGYWSFIRGNP